MKIRAHHLLCLPHFVGVGYDGAFTANMAAKKQQLEAENRFELTVGCDEICAACPLREGERCRTQEKVMRYDTNVRERLDLQTGAAYSYAEISARVRTELLAPETFRTLCGDCEWFSLCAKM